MDLHEAMTQLGGVATRAQLLELVPRAAVDRALREDTLAILGRGRYALPDADRALQRAQALGGVLSLTSAAVRHGWAVKSAPEEPHVIVPRKRRVAAAHRAGVQLHRYDLGPDDADGLVTSKELTLEQCLRWLPFDEALAVADSALRAGEHTLLRRVSAVRGPGALQARRVAGLATADAANPFESVLRAIALGVPGLNVRPQVQLRCHDTWIRPDLVDTDLRIVLEADSFAWHGDRAALRRDARRYDLLVTEGWLVLRFAWEDVMHDSSWVAEVLMAVVQRTHLPCGRCPA